MSEDTREFFLLDMRHKPKGPRFGRPQMHRHDCPLMVWWGVNNSGYGNSLADPWVGRYTAAKIKEHLNYYKPGEATLPIPCDVALRFSVPRPETFMGIVGSKWCDGPGPIVINHALIWDLLEPLAWIPGGPAHA